MLRPNAAVQFFTGIGADKPLDDRLGALLFFFNLRGKGFGFLLGFKPYDKRADSNDCQNDSNHQGERDDAGPAYCRENGNDGSDYVKCGGRRLPVFNTVERHLTCKHLDGRQIFCPSFSENLHFPVGRSPADFAEIFRTFNLLFHRASSSIFLFL